MLDELNFCLLDDDKKELSSVSCVAFLLGVAFSIVLKIIYKLLQSSAFKVHIFIDARNVLAHVRNHWEHPSNFNIFTFWIQPK